MCPVTSHRCNFLNAPGSSFCSQCGLALTDESRERVVHEFDGIEEDPRIKLIREEMAKAEAELMKKLGL